MSNSLSIKTTVGLYITVALIILGMTHKTENIHRRIINSMHTLAYTYMTTITYKAIPCLYSNLYHYHDGPSEEVAQVGHVTQKQNYRLVKQAYSDAHKMLARSEVQWNR